MANQYPDPKGHLGQLAWTIPQYAYLIGKSPRTVKRYIEDERLKAIRIANGTWMIPRAAGLSFMHATEEDVA